MEANILSYFEILDSIEKGKPYKILPDQVVSSFYSAKRKYFPPGSKKAFSIRTEPGTKDKYIKRIK